MQFVSVKSIFEDLKCAFEWVSNGFALVGLGFRWLMAHANHLGFSGRHVTCICLELSTCVFCFFNIKPPTRDNSVAFCSVSGYSPAIEPRVTIKILIKTEFNL